MELMVFQTVGRCQSSQAGADHDAFLRSLHVLFLWSLIGGLNEPRECRSALTISATEPTDVRQPRPDASTLDAWSAADKVKRVEVLADLLRQRIKRQALVFEFFDNSVLAL